MNNDFFSIKKDCFAFNGSGCCCLNDLYCSFEKCNFYKISEIEKAIKDYKDRRE